MYIHSYIPAIPDETVFENRSENASSEGYVFSILCQWSKVQGSGFRV
jgi:hypothetical protein